MNQIRLYGKPLRVNMAAADRRQVTEIGAELFVGNLDPLVDERMLYETFSKFGSMSKAPQIRRNEANESRGFGFVSFDSFEASDRAIAAMNHQFMMNKQVTVSYAFKKDGRGDRHGDEAERKLAAAAQRNNVAPARQTVLPPGFTPEQPVGMSATLPVGAAMPPAPGPAQ